MSNQPNQQQQRREELTTYILVPDEEPDRGPDGMCAQYLEAKQVLGPDGRPKQESTRVVTELRVDRLTDRHRVIVLYRDTSKDRTRKIKTAPDEPMTYDTTHAEVKETQPILVRDYWTRADSDAFIEGELDVPRFFAEISKRARGIVLKWHPDQEPGILRARYA